MIVPTSVMPAMSGCASAPAHLWAGTHEENMQDKIAKGRANIPNGERWHGFHDASVARGDRAAASKHPHVLANLFAWRDTKPERQARGERQGSAKLTEAQVVEMRTLRTQGWTLLELAKRYATTQTNVSTIVRRLGWKHV